jgi:ABC-2 type transport system ATP-binding protein
MERVCDRVIVIHRGRLLLDRSTPALRSGFIERKRITVHSAAERIDVSGPGVRVTQRRAHCTELDVDLRSVSVEQVVQSILAQTALDDLSIEDPPMDEIVQAIYARAERESTGDLNQETRRSEPWPVH